MAASPNRVAANQANAPKHAFNPDPFAIVRIEDRAAIATLVADAIATYQPINSQERSAVERIALAQHSILRMYTLEAGFFTNCLDQAMAGPADPNILNRSELATGIEISLQQHRAYWLAFGFNLLTRQSKLAATFLRFQAQAERLHRRAVEDFHRLLKLRGQLPPEKYDDPIEPKIEPIPAPQPEENTAAPVEGPPISPPRPAAEHKAEPRPVLDPAMEESPPAHHPNPMVLPNIVDTQEVSQKRQAAESRAPP